MADPAAVVAALSFREALLAREAAQVEAMARAWRDVERAIEAELGLLAQELADEGRATRTALLRQERYRSLLAQLRREVTGFEGAAATLITEGQRAAGMSGAQMAAAAIDAAIPNRIGAYFARLPVEAVENMVGMLGDGTPLRRLLRKVYADAAEGMTRELIAGTALGRNPREVARRALNGGAAGLNRALTIARTEQLRTFREAARQQYQASGVVTSYRRLAARNSRTCMACLLSDGEEYELSEPLRAHPNCRCTSVPVVKGMPAPKWQTGRAWFAAQDEATQRAMMGPGRYEAWRAGKFGLDDLVTIHQSDEWGESVRPTPLSDLT